MARWKGRFSPITLMPDERELLRKRESLRWRGLGWAMPCGLALALLMFLFGAGIAARGWQDGAEVVVGTISILLALFALPAFFVMAVAWLERSYTLNAREICLRQGMFARLNHWFRQLSDQPAALPAGNIACAQVRRVSVEPAAWPMGWFDIGDVVISSRDRARALVMRHISHPYLVEREIRRYARRAVEPANAGEGELPTRSYRTSLVGLTLQAIPGLIFLWCCAAAWGGLRLAAWLGVDKLWVVIEALSILLAISLLFGLISFTRWFYCVYLITDRRVVGRQGLFVVHQTDLRLEEVVSVSVTQADVARYVDVGTVQVNTAGHSGNVKMVNISEPHLVRSTILDIQERLRRQRLRMDFDEIHSRLVKALRL